MTHESRSRQENYHDISNRESSKLQGDSGSTSNIDNIINDANNGDDFLL